MFFVSLVLFCFVFLKGDFWFFESFENRVFLHSIYFFPTLSSSSSFWHQQVEIYLLLILLIERKLVYFSSSSSSTCLIVKYIFMFPLFMYVLILSGTFVVFVFFRFFVRLLDSFCYNTIYGYSEREREIIFRNMFFGVYYQFEDKVTIERI